LLHPLRPAHNNTQHHHLWIPGTDSIVELHDIVFSTGEYIKENITQDCLVSQLMFFSLNFRNIAKLQVQNNWKKDYDEWCT
jgi:hypothetical protein